jgi:RHS repeat-associated protein
MTRGGTTQTRTFTYDSSTQRLTQATTPEAGTVQYSYNGDGTLLSKTDALAQQTQYTYDSLARVTQVSYLPNGSEDTCQRVYYRYDGYPFDPYADPQPLLGTSSIGRLTGMSWTGGPSCSYGFQEEYTYDAQGRVWERIFTITNVGYPGATPITLTSYFYYDAEGRLTVSQYPAATSINTSATTTYSTDHDALGRPSELYSGTQQQPTWLVSGAAYNAAGQLTAMSTNAYTETLQYNANLQLVRIAAGGGQGIDFTYTYPTSGNNGRISQMADNISGEQVSYTYDQLNRLVQSASSLTRTIPFAYDGFGNLTQQGQTTLSVDPTTNRINSAGYQYNANGNVIQTPGSPTYAYDVANRLVSNNAIYNPRNQRVFDGTNIYLYTPEGKLAGKYTANWSTNGSVASIQGNQPNVYFAGKLIQEQGQWVMTDRLGSVRLNGSNGVWVTSSYQPYGAEVTPTTNDQRTKFATYYRDSAGLDYAGQRYYSSNTGSFFSPDPSMDNVDYANPGSWNAYAYANGDPINFNDPDGLQACGNIPVLGGEFQGQTVSQVMTGTTGEDLLAQVMWHEGGTIYQSDLTSNASVAAYGQDLTAIGTAVLNQWDVDDGRLKVYQNGRAVCPLGHCLDRTLQQIIIAIATDNNGCHIQFERQHAIGGRLEAQRYLEHHLERGASSRLM